MGGSDEKKTKKKKNKVSPEKGDGKESKDGEEKEKVEAMDNNVKRKLARPYKVGAGLVPHFIASLLPPSITNSSSVLFGSKTVKDLKGMPAAVIRMLRLSRSQVRAIKKCFDAIDLDGTGEISVAEFIHFLKAADTVFVRAFVTKALFGVNDLNSGMGVMTFGDFLLAVAVICTFSKDQVLYRVFRVYDNDSSKDLDHKEMEHLTRNVLSMAGEASFDGNLEVFLEKLDVNADGVVDFDEFVALNRDFPMVFYPAFKVQDELRKHTFGGAHAWLNVVDRWDAKEMAKAKADGRDPESMSDQLEKVGMWFEEQRAARGTSRGKGNRSHHAGGPHHHKPHMAGAVGMHGGKGKAMEPRKVQVNQNKKHDRRPSPP